MRAWSERVWSAMLGVGGVVSEGVWRGMLGVGRSGE